MATLIFEKLQFLKEMLKITKMHMAFIGIFDQTLHF